jgi:hypothetical protein
MNRRIVFATVILLITCSSGVSQAQNIFPGFRRTAVYSVKFLCGFQDAVAGSPSPNGQTIIGPQIEPPVKPGNYATAVNIHNFHTFPVTLCKKAVLAPPEHCIDNSATTPNCLSRQSKPRPVPLGPDDAFEVDCQDIVSLLFPPGTTPPPPFIKGFVEIAVVPQFFLPLTNPISVTGVYTSTTCPDPFNPASGTCSSLDAIHFAGSGAGLEVVPQNSFVGEPTCG